MHTTEYLMRGLHSGHVHRVMTSHRVKVLFDIAHQEYTPLEYLWTTNIKLAEACSLAIYF